MRHLAIAAAALLLAAGPVRAQDDLQAWAVAQGALCTAAVAAAERAHGVPPGLLLAIAKVESGRPLPPDGRLGPWPWTADVAGSGAFFDSKPAAVAGVRDALRRTANVDVGCMQVSLLHHPNAFPDLDTAFDPAANAEYAAGFLQRLMAGPAGGDWRRAAGFYHSQTPALAAAYLARVDAVLAGLPLPAAGGPRPLFLRAVQRGPLRLVLEGGAVMVVRAGAGARWARAAPCRAAPAGDGGPRMVRCHVPR